jgi:hypothetical protein
VHEARTAGELMLTSMREHGRAPPAIDSANESPAASLGRLGGLKGGKARAAKLSKKKRAEIAKKAAKARWGTKPKQRA